VRIRSVAVLLARELLGADLTLPDLPVLKGIRGLGMSDGPELAAQLEKKFDYRNTFYHKAPRFDVTELDPQEEGRYDFIISSEVMEHIPAPVEQGFHTLYRMLRPEGVLILTVPYGLDGPTKEHFPELYEYALAAPGGGIVLVNRKTDGTLETFDNLVFHGGPGSTLETRLFSEDGLRTTIRGAGFGEVEIFSGNIPEFGVEHAVNWSLPVIARKTRARSQSRELAEEYRKAQRETERLKNSHAILEVDYQKFTEYHKQYDEEKKRELAERTEWARGLERDLDERTRWALALEEERNQMQAACEEARTSEQEAWTAAKALEKELVEAREARARLERALWTRIGRKLGGI
jgi:hypothetical protein